MHLSLSGFFEPVRTEAGEFHMLNGRPHFSTVGGGQLFYQLHGGPARKLLEGRWCLTDQKPSVWVTKPTLYVHKGANPYGGICKASDSMTAWLATTGALPLGEVVWQYKARSTWVSRPHLVSGHLVRQQVAGGDWVVQFLLRGVDNSNNWVDRNLLH